MRVGIIGTGAISHKHALAYRNIGYDLTVCTDINEQAGRQFAAEYGAEFVPAYQALELVLSVYRSCREGRAVELED